MGSVCWILLNMALLVYHLQIASQELEFLVADLYTVCRYHKHKYKSKAELEDI